MASNGVAVENLEAGIMKIMVLGLDICMGSSPRSRD